MRSFVALGVFLCSGGCADDSGAIALGAAPAAYASAYCERALACCETAELQAIVGNDVVDRASCEAAITRIFGNEFIDDTRRAIAMGQARYDGDAMAACVRHLRTDVCVHAVRSLRLMTFPMECDPVRIGQVQLGGACDHDFQCATGACTGGADHATGQCEEVPAIGAPCPAGDCRAGAYCDRSGTTPVCAAVSSQGETCTTSLGCASLNCAMGVCGPPLSCAG